MSSISASYILSELLHTVCKILAMAKDNNIINELRNGEKHFRALIENSTDVIALINPLGKVLYASPAIKNVLGYTPEEFMGTNGLKYVHPQDLPRIMKELSKIILKPGSHATVDVRIKHKNGSWVWIESRGTNLLHDPSVRAIVSNFRDITERRQMEENLQISEIRHRTMIEQSPLSIQILSPDGKTLQVNKAWEKLWGTTIEFLKDYNMLKDKQLVALGIMSYIKKGFKGEYTHIPAVKYIPNKTIPESTDIPYRWVRAIIYPVKDDRGAIREVVLIHEDITQQKDAEEKVQQSEQQLQAILDASPAVIFMKDRQGRYILINKQYEKLFKITRDNIKGKTDYDLFPKETADHVTHHDKEVVATGKSLEIEEIVPHDGGLHTYISIKFPLFDSQGEIHAVCGIATDITERKQVEQRKEDFINIASHELRTPITSVKIFAHVLQKSFELSGDKKAIGTFKKMDKQIDKLSVLVGDLLNLAKIQTGRFEFRKEYFEIDDLVRETVEGLQGSIDRHKIILDGQANIKVYADRDRIGQVLINLLTNAVKYSPAADKVIVHSEKNRDNITVYVQDFGIGIPKEAQNKIFERFFRVEGKDEKTYPGFGIGLFLSSEIIRRHNGKIWVESKKNKGSTFYFTLPIKS
jgi:PAS domain S-box-containing protein